VRLVAAAGCVVTARIALSVIVTIAGVGTVLHKQQHRHPTPALTAVSALPSASDLLAERVSRSRERAPLLVPVKRGSTRTTRQGPPRPTPNRRATPAGQQRHLHLVHNWTAVAECESSDDWHINTGNGYYGGVQMDMTFWRNYGGPAFAARPDLATEEQQITVAERGLAVQGRGAWPVCGRYL
jgi:hypothetical protein